MSIFKKNFLREVERHYNKEASCYNDVYSDNVCQAEDRVLSEILKPFIKGKVLDLGSGDGLLCRILDVGDYIGIDISPEMVKKALKLNPKKTFIVGDMHKLPFKDNSFDTVVSLFGPISYSINPEKLIKEIIRVTKPGGYIVLMPYTLRLGNRLNIRGYSTALNNKIRKTYYTTSLLKKLMTPLENVEVLGINYFLNTYMDYLDVMDHKKKIAPVNSLVDFLKKESLFGLLPEYARHMVGIGKKPE